MSKKKRNKTTKGRSKGGVADWCMERTWSDVDEAFFASAPPDQPEPPAAPESFDDLLPIPSPRAAGRGIPAARETSIRLSRGVVTIALATVLMLISAVVFASLI
jgi:hypothetical protein